MIQPRMSHDSTNSYLTYQTAESEKDEGKQELQELKGKLLKIKEKKDQESLGSWFYKIKQIKNKNKIWC